MSGYRQEEDELAEREFEDEIRAGLAARTFDELHELRLSASALAEVLRRCALAERHYHGGKT